MPVQKQSLSLKKIDLRFLKSNAFYAILIGAISVTLLDPAIETAPWYVSLGKFLGFFSAGFWGTRSLDRTVDKFTGN